MSRLTARTETGHAYLVNVKPDEQEVDSPHKNTLQCILDCFERLAQYEDAEGQGRLVVLPCKVGDFLYWVEDGQVFDARTLSAHIDEYTIWFEDDNGNEFSRDEFAEHIGKTVFLTRAEAEAALKGGAE